MTVDSIAILQRFYDPPGPAYRMLVDHGRAVAQKALAIADRLQDPLLDRAFVEEAAMLHDIGIYLTRCPGIGCTGAHDYICHGVLGRRILTQLGLPRHGLVCERHVGAGISAAEIRQRRLPLPVRDMLPLSLEEQLICYADKFFSKNGNGSGAEKSVAQILDGMKPYGEDQTSRFLAWVERFEP